MEFCKSKCVFGAHAQASSFEMVDCVSVFFFTTVQQAGTSASSKRGQALTRAGSNEGRAGSREGRATRHLYEALPRRPTARHLHQRKPRNPTLAGSRQHLRDTCQSLAEKLVGRQRTSAPASPWFPDTAGSKVGIECR